MHYYILSLPLLTATPVFARPSVRPPLVKEFLGSEMDTATSVIATQLQNSRATLSQNGDNVWTEHKACIRAPGDDSDRFYWKFSVGRFEKDNDEKYVLGQGAWLQRGVRDAIQYISFETRSRSKRNYVPGAEIYTGPWTVEAKRVLPEMQRYGPQRVTPELLDKMGCVLIETPKSSAVSSNVSPAATFSTASSAAISSTVSPAAASSIRSIKYYPRPTAVPTNVEPDYISRRSNSDERVTNGIYGQQVGPAMKWVATQMIQQEKKKDGPTSSYSVCVRDPDISTTYTLFQLTTENGDNVSIDANSKDWLKNELEKTLEAARADILQSKDFHGTAAKVAKLNDDWTLKVLSSKGTAYSPVNEDVLDRMGCMDVQAED